MKKIIGTIIISSLLVSSCSEINQNVTYNQYDGICVETYTNGVWTHSYNDFHISHCNLESPYKIDSIKKLQMKMAQEYLQYSSK